MKKKSAVKMKKAPRTEPRFQLKRENFVFEMPSAAQIGGAAMRGKTLMESGFFNFKTGMRRLVIALELLLVAILFIAVMAYWRNLKASDEYPIENIHVLGHQPEAVERALAEKLMKYQNIGFFDVDLAEMQDSLSEVPWVRTVSVNRRWPNALVIDLDTWEPVARWGEEQWLDNTGKLFALEMDLTTHEDLPLLSGPEDDAMQVFKMHQQIKALFSHYGMELAALHKMPSGSWQVEMGSGVKVRLKEDEIFEGLRDFVKIYGQIAEQQGYIDYVDMRYPDGAAIRWRQEAVATINNNAESAQTIVQ